MLNHDEIRFRILSLLYEKYWKDSGESYVNTNDLINDLKITVERNEIYRNILYLHKKNLISGTKVTGSEPLPGIKNSVCNYTNNINLLCHHSKVFL